jgi:hypothetical protein
MSSRQKGRVGVIESGPRLERDAAGENIIGLYQTGGACDKLEQNTDILSSQAKYAGLFVSIIL